jgi:heme exporter protein D
MGGYAFYVWGSFGAALAVFAWNVVAPRLERARLQRALREADRPCRGAGGGCWAWRCWRWA